MSITMYTKKECGLCDKAKRVASQHGITIDHIVCAQNLYDVVKMFGDYDNITSFPVFHIEGSYSLLNYDDFFERYGEPILLPNPNRHVLFPIKYADMWDMYERAVASFWTVSEIDFSKDESDFECMSDNERSFIKRILAFFAGADGIVNENIDCNFSDEVQVPEARAFYSYQQFNETIHSHNYSLMIDRYVQSSDERNILLQGIHTISCVGKKAEWAMKWMNTNNCPSFAKRLVAFACVEGIMFSGSFCAIFWLKKRGLMPGLSFSNELISRDEGMHQDFAVLLFKHLRNRPSQSEINSIVQEAVEFEKEFIVDSIPCRMVGMNDKLMCTYIEFVADRLLLQLGYDSIWKSKNPFDFMETICLGGKTNFFERRVGEYAKAGVLTSRMDDSSNYFGTDEDF
jgi:ribonucleotide reductase beta subunit family protein with ferritin-like domain/glutaredoxin